MSEETTSTPRGKPSDEGRFIWLSCLAVERILNAFGANQAAYGIAVYVALCRLAAKARNAGEIAATVMQIAGMARLSYRKTFAVLHELQDVAGVIAITGGERKPGSPGQLPCRYTLLSFKRASRKPAETARYAVTRLHGMQSSDCIGRTRSDAEIPIDPPKGGDKETDKAAAATGLGASAAGQSVSEKNPGAKCINTF